MVPRKDRQSRTVRWFWWTRRALTAMAGGCAGAREISSWLVPTCLGATVPSIERPVHTEFDAVIGESVDRRRESLAIYMRS